MSIGYPNSSKNGAIIVAVTPANNPWTPNSCSSLEIRSIKLNSRTKNPEKMIRAPIKQIIKIIIQDLKENRLS